MSGTPALVYLEADDEITSVVRRVRTAEAGRVIVVAPGRSHATSSAVALRLLARVGAGEGREVVVVGDALTRSLATDAGLPAFASVEDARQASLQAGAEPAVGASSGPRHAAIRVVRGAAPDETAPTMAAVAPPVSEALDETRAHAVVPRPAPRRSTALASRARRRPSLRFAAPIAALGALLLAGVVGGVTVLPAATITVVPAGQHVAASYEIAVADPVRRGGTVDAATTVVATGEYEILEAASGEVVFFNWTFEPVAVPAGTFVAAGEQAFATQADVTVPRGRLVLPQGTIAAGEQAVAVVAAAAGPAANVAADAIDTVLDEQVDARLRGFPENPQRRVTNPQPTSGGVSAQGPEITEADVEAAVAGLHAELDRLVEEARPDDPDRLIVEPAPSEPVLDLPDGLAGTRDEPEVEITGSRSWEVILVDTEGVEAEVASRLTTDSAIPAGHDLIGDATTVRLGEPRLDGDRVIVDAQASGRAVPRIDPGEVLERSRGLTPQEVGLALAGLGEAEVVLWPGWVTTVPELDWRIEVRIAEARP